MRKRYDGMIQRQGSPNVRRLVGVLLIGVFLMQLKAEQKTYAQETLNAHASVLALKPAGYWPADDGEGGILMDRSGKDRHGRAYNLDWANGLLDFTSGYQWVELPAPPAGEDGSFSLGGWYFTRRDDYAGGTDLKGNERQATGPHHKQGVSLINNAYGGRGGWVLWDYGMREMESGVGLRLRSGGSSRYSTGTLLGVVHGCHADQVDSALEGVSVDAGAWCHVLYTYSQGIGTLYLDGKKVASKSGLSYQHSERPFVVGNDMTWWMLYPNGSESLNGSVQDIVFFDRPLSASEVGTLFAATMPDIKPVMVDDEVLVAGGLVIPLEEFTTCPRAWRKEALEDFAKRGQRRLRAVAGLLLPALEEAFNDWELRAVATRILLKVNNKASREMLKTIVLPGCSRALTDANLSDEERAGAALALAEMGERAQSAVPLLLEAYAGLPECDKQGPPRVEQLLRNSLLRALLDIGRDFGEVRKVLSESLARPLLEQVDLERSDLQEVRNQMKGGRTFQAMETLRSLDPQEIGIFYFSEGDIHRDRRDGLTPNQRAYAPVVESDGVTYTVGSGIPWESATKVSQHEYKAAIQSLPEEYQEAARTWEYARSKQLYKVVIHKDAPGEERESAVVEGDWLIFDGRDAKLRGWTIDIDSEGYLHLLGGMHNVPNPQYYVPGSWEKMGFGRSPETAPATMYWVSKRPGDITEWEFVGARDNPRNLPSAGMNYMNFVRDADNHMFLYGRITAQGIQSWGMYRYYAKEQHWQPIGGDARDIVQQARERDPRIFVQRGGGLWQPAAFKEEERCFAWGWQPHFYNFIRGWGTRFDQTGRLHVRMPLHALGEDNRILDNIMYAWSDDLGQTFHSVDGTPLQLPLTLNPAPDHNADVMTGARSAYWDSWVSLLEEAGYRVEEINLREF